MTIPVAICQTRERAAWECWNAPLMMPIFPIYLSNSQDGRVILHPLPPTEKIPAQKCLCSSFHVVFPSFSPSLPVNRLPFFSFLTPPLCVVLLASHICTTYTYIYFLFNRYENAIWICIADILGNCQWWAAMHNAALSVAHLHLLRHTLSRMHTHRSSHPVPKDICTQSLFRSLSHLHKHV